MYSLHDYGPWIVIYIYIYLRLYYILCASKEISNHYIIETVDSLICIWDGGNVHNHINDCIGQKEEDQGG